MAKTASDLLFLLSILCIAGITMAAITLPTSEDTSFVKISCKSTTYPPLCLRSLSSYATVIRRSPQQMAQIALSLSLSRAQSTESFLSKMNKFKNLKRREYGAIADCLDLMDDSVDRLRRSVQELKNIGQPKRRDFSFHMSNVQTWVSAALTDHNTCLDGFADKALDGKVNDSVKAHVVRVVKITSNALALVN